MVSSGVPSTSNVASAVTSTISQEESPNIFGSLTYEELNVLQDPDLKLKELIVKFE